MKNNFYKILLIVILSAAGLISFSSAQKKDAIGIRIFPNEEHLPASVWYRKQGFEKTGNPAPVAVDGYDGIRDGNTIYVNVANILYPEVFDFYYCKNGGNVVKCGADAENKNSNFYTNIYAISYTKDFNKDAENLFSQIIKNWKFNSNINLKTPCNNCGEMARLYSGQNEVDTAKAALRRDTRRLADIVFMQTEVLGGPNDPPGKGTYYEVYKHYPKLDSGAYIANETLSLWPSWQETLGAELKLAMPKDPINSFYPFEKCPAEESDCYCNGHDPATCWDNKARLFNGKNSIIGGLGNGNNDYSYTAGTGENATTKIANLKNAMVYYYKGSNDGSSYEFSAWKWETPYIGGDYVNQMKSSHAGGNSAPSVYEIGDINIAPGDIRTIELLAYDYDKHTKSINWENPVVTGTCLKNNNPSLSYGNRKDGWAGSRNRFESSRKIVLESMGEIQDKCESDVELSVSDGEAVKSYTFKVSVKNSAPKLKGLSKITGIVGNDFEAKILADDSLNDTLTYEILGTLPAGLQLSGNKILGMPEKIETQTFTIIVKDKAFAYDTMIAAISILNKSPRISTDDNIPPQIVAYPWSFKIEVDDNEVYNEIDKLPHPHTPLSVSFAENGMPPAWLSFKGKAANETIAINEASGKVELSGEPREDKDIKNFSFILKVEDSAGAETLKPFSGSITNRAPVILEWPEEDVVRHIGEEFYYQIIAEDEDIKEKGHGQVLEYKLLDEFENIKLLEINSSTGYIKTIGEKFAISNVKASDYQLGRDITINVSDSYGNDSKNFRLKIAASCGNGFKEPTEICDGVDGVASGPSDSSSSKMYACDAKCGFLSGDAGGYCGDGIIQDGSIGTVNFGEVCDPKQSLDGEIFCANDCALITATLNGNIKEALTGNNIRDVNVSVQRQDGMEVEAGVSDSNGNFTINNLVLSHDFKIVINKEGYKIGGIEHLEFIADLNVQLYMLPADWAGVAAIILRWGSSPADLDSHLLFGSTHIHYGNKSGNGAKLDLDDQKSYGPETVTIGYLVEGVNYEYYVQDYTNCKNNTGGHGTTAGANVQVWNSYAQKIAEYESPGAGCRWNVFQMNDDGEIIE